MWNDFFAQRDLFNQDGCIHVEGFLKAAESYCSWKDVENSIHRDDVFWELIAEDGNKKELGMYKPYWSPVPCQEKEVIYEHVRDGGGFVITGYSRVNRKAKALCTEIERHFNVNCDIHCYGTRGGGRSFKAHYDNFSNFIIQTVGETKWTVYKNRATSLFRVQHDKLQEDKLEVEWEGILKPGDLIYIPDRAYHKAEPSTQRLSMSIPCLPTIMESEFYDRRYYEIPSLESLEKRYKQTSD